MRTMLPRKSWMVYAAATALTFLFMASTAMACPGCKEALAAVDGSQGDLVTGVFWSILFMMSMPFLIVGVFSVSIYRSVRRARAGQGAVLAGQSQSSPGQSSPAEPLHSTPNARESELLEV